MIQKEQVQKIFSSVCLNTKFCQDKECQLDHSRVFVGVCIEYLSNEQKFYNEGGDEFSLKDCNNENCKLWHFNEEKFNDLLKGKTINGVFPHNLCPESCKLKDCKFLHREWAKQICLTNVVKKCRNPQCKFNHQDWESLQAKAKSCSIINFTTPEEMCSKKECNCGKHPVALKDYCTLYLQGLCPNKKCLKIHIDWEKINTKINQNNSLKSCIVLKSEQTNQIQTDPKNNLIMFCKGAEEIHYKKWFHEQNIIDVVFIMDLTGSMKPYKEYMQNTINSIIDKFLQSINQYQVRVAFVGYRDVCDKDEQLVHFTFTKKISELQNYIKRLEAKGGGDCAEDVAAGFEQALKLNFSHHPDSLLCTFLLADAPCHGKDYHNYKDFQNDNLFDKMPDKYLEKVLEKYKQIKRNNNYLSCVKINDSTNIMYEKIKAVFPMLIIRPAEKPENLGDEILFTLRKSVTESIKLKTVNNTDFEYFNADFIKLKLDTNDNNGQDYQNQNYWKEFQEQCLTRKGETGLKVDMHYIDYKSLNYTNTTEPKAAQSSIFIFKAFDAINNRDVVIKIPKYIIDKDKDKITQEEIIRAEQEAEIRFYSSCYACQMAYFFNQRLKQNDLLNEMQPLFYAHPILYTLETPFYGLKKVYGETYMQTEQYVFEKYTNNTDFFNCDKYFYTAFSHFSYQVSEGLLVIVDLQGCNNILSDPSIQTKDDWQSILTKDKTNKGNKGIFIFTNSQHKQCSYLCQKLKLEQFQNNQEKDETVCPEDIRKNIFGICYECDQHVQFEEEMLENMKDSKFTFKCKFCQSAMSEPLIEDQCSCCYEKFFTHLNQQLINKTMLRICQNCKRQCIKKLYSCFYCERNCQGIMTTITINNESIYICKNAHEYLQAFRCKKCSQPYNWKSKIEIKDYEQGSFTCC